MKYLDIKGKTVVTTSEKYVGKVLDLLVNPDDAKLYGLIVSKNNAIRCFYYIPFNNFKMQRGVIILNGMISKVKKSFLRKNRRQSLQNYINKEIVSPTGVKLGMLTDCIFDYTTGKILALVSSKGFFEDLFDGRKIYITKGNLIFKEQNIVIKQSCCSCSINSNAFYKKYLKE